MHLKNEAARLITINILEGAVVTPYAILPGENPAVEVPDSAAQIDFVKALLKNGSLRRVGPDELGIAEIDEQDDDGESDEKAQLIAEAEELGVAIDKRWGIAKLKEAIDNA